MRIEELIFLLILLFPLLQKLFGRKQQPKRPEPASAEPDGDWDFEPISEHPPRRERAPQPSRPQPTRREPVGARPEAEPDSLAEALRQIREALGQPEPPAPPPAPPQRAPSRLDRPRPTARPEPPSHIEPMLGPKVRTSRPAPVEARVVAESVPSRVQSLNRPHSKLIKELRTPEGARKAFVIREMLDKPLALRGRR